MIHWFPERKNRKNRLLWFVRFWIFFPGGFSIFPALYSRLLHQPPLILHCVGGCWDGTQGSLALPVRGSNHSARSHQYSARSHQYSARSHPHLARSHPHSARSHPHLARSHPHSARSHPHLARSHPHSARSHPQSARPHPLLALISPTPG